MLPADMPTAEEQIELLAFEAASEAFFLPVRQVKEIRSWSEPTPLPLAEPAMKGVINLRGTVLPLVDLATALQLPDTGCAPPRVIVVLEDRGRITGLIVTRVIDIISVPASTLKPPPQISAHPPGPGIAAIALHDGKLIRVLCPKQLFPAAREDAA
ncbi:MAG: chemotaxis protein CheW [Albidovulum sp.]